MRTLVSVVIGLIVLLPLDSLRAADTDAVMTAKATTLLRKLQGDVSTVNTSSLIDLGEFRGLPITGDSLQGGWNTYYRYGDVRFRSRGGFGYDISPEHDSISILRPDSLYVGLTIASRRDPIASTRSFDLAPYLPGCRLYVYYRENLFGQAYLNDMHVTPTESKIYRKIEERLAALGATSPGSRTAYY